MFCLSSEVPPWVALVGESPEPKTAAQTVMAAAMPMIGGRLLDCVDLSQFDQTVDQLLSDKTVAHAYALFFEAAMAGPPPRIAPNASLKPEVATFIGAGAASLLEKCSRDVVAQSEAAFVLFDKMPTQTRSAAVANMKNVGSLDWFVTCPETPVDVRQMALLWTTGGLCGMGIAVAMAAKKRISDWLGLVLAEKFILGARAYVSYVRSIPGIKLENVPDSCPAIDLVRMYENHQESRWGLRLSMLRHRASGKSISAPLGGVPDEDQKT